MTEFIIASISDQDRYIQYDKLGRMCVTNRREKAARFTDSGKAWRILTTQMSKKKRDGWKVVAYVDDTEKQNTTKESTTQRYRADVYNKSISDEQFNWEKVRCDITTSFSDIIAYKERLVEKLNQIEAELCDCEHACEFFKCDASHGYKLYVLCQTYGHSWNAKISERTIDKINCKECEYEFQSVLLQLLVLYYCKIAGLNAAIMADNAIGIQVETTMPELRLIIERYDKLPGNINRRAVKEFICKKNGITYIEVKTNGSTELAEKVKEIFRNNHIFIPTKTEQDIQICRSNFFQWKNRQKENGCQ